MHDIDALGLDELLRLAREARPFDRVELYRDVIARRGQPAVEAMEDWLADPVLVHFALRVIAHAGLHEARDAAVRALANLAERQPELRADVAIELKRLGAQLKPPTKSQRPAFRGRHPYDVETLSPSAGLRWLGFQRADFGNIAGTTWRRRNDSASLPPLVLGALRQIHPHFSSWGVERSPEVHFAISDRYRQFDEPESGWRAAKLVVYAHGPTGEHPETVPQVIAGLYIEKGGGDAKFGPVDARWDWPRFVSSLVEPSINGRLADAMARHRLQIGDLFSQRFQPEPDRQIGGAGRIDGDDLVFRSPAGAEVFRGWEAARHHLESLSAEVWHDLHIWRTWPADEAIAAGPSFATEALAPVLTDLAEMYLLVIKDALAEGIHALHRVVQRRRTPDGRPEIVFLAQAHEQPGHFGVPLAVMAELGIPLGGRIHLSVSTLEDRQHFIGTLDTRSGPEIYYRVGDPETDGLQQIGSKEWISVAASRPTT